MNQTSTMTVFLTLSAAKMKKTSFNDYALVNTLAECLYHGISREIFDGSEPALRAVIANGEIKFSARYTLRGACYYEPLGRFPRMSIKDARECARELYNRFDDNRVPDEEYGAIPF